MDPQAVTIILFIAGVLFSVIQLFIGTILGLIWWEIRKLRERVHGIEGSVAVMGAVLKAHGILNGNGK